MQPTYTQTCTHIHIKLNRGCFCLYSPRIIILFVLYTPVLFEYIDLNFLYKTHSGYIYSLNGLLRYKTKSYIYLGQLMEIHVWRLYLWLRVAELTVLEDTVHLSQCQDR